MQLCVQLCDPSPTLSLSFTNLADLRAYEGSGTSAVVVAHTTNGDGGGGSFTIDPADVTSADDNAMVIEDAGGRRWKRQFSGPLSPRWFGGVSDHNMSFPLATMTAGSPTLTVDRDTFIAGDIGKYAFVDRCGPNGNQLIAAIVTVNGPRSITLSASAVKGTTNRQIFLRYGTECGAALQAMFDYGWQNNLPWHIPPGFWLTSQTLIIKQPIGNGNVLKNPAPLWGIDPGATIKACAPIAGPVIQLGTTDSDYTQFTRDCFLNGGTIDCSFIADIGILAPFGVTTTIVGAHIKNQKYAGISLGKIGAPAAVGGHRVSYCSFNRDVEYLALTAITRGTTTTFNVSEHNWDNDDVVTVSFAPGCPQAEKQFFQIKNVTANTFDLVATDSTSWGALSADGLIARCMPSMRVPFKITGYTKANPVQFTVAGGHPFMNSVKVDISQILGVPQSDLVDVAVGSVTATTFTIPGVDSTGWPNYPGGGIAREHVDWMDMASAIYCENASDIDTQWNQICGVRVGFLAPSALVTGWDGKHAYNHHWNYNEQGEMLHAYVLGGDATLVGVQVDGPFSQAFRFDGPRNQLIGCRINYTTGGVLANTDDYASIVWLGAGASCRAIGGGWKGEAAFRLYADAVGPGAGNFIWNMVDRDHVIHNADSEYATRANARFYSNVRIFDGYLQLNGHRGIYSVDDPESSISIGGGAAYGDGGEVQVYGGSSSSPGMVQVRSNAVDLMVLRPGGDVRIYNLPTSAAGLSSGQLWRDAAAGNVIKMAP